MHLLLLLDMAAADRPDAVAVRSDERSLTYAQLLGAAWAGAAHLRAAGAVDGVAHVGTNGPGFPIGLFAAAAAEVPFVPLNYRLPVEQLSAMIRARGELLVVAEGAAADALRQRGHRVIDVAELVEVALAGADTASGDVPFDADAPALLLHTSGTTSAPKAAVLRHRHLSAYIISSVEFGGAGEGEAVLVSVPAYHIAGVANLLSNVYLGRTIVYLQQFDAETWLDLAESAGATHAMVVPTMLARICDALEARTERPDLRLRNLSYGGARTPAAVLERTMALLPDVGLVNAYGLTETSSTIAVLGPDDHRAALLDDDPAARARLSSAGRVLPGVEVEVRDGDGRVLAGGGVGELWVRGEQVSGEYAGLAAPTDAEGWFPTRDRGWVDDGGFLFVEGRSDDTIIRGGENVAPAEIEEVLVRHPDVDRCAVVGLPDDEWGQVIAAVVVPRPGATPDAGSIREHVRAALRSSKVPDVVTFADELPTTETGKLLRRVVVGRFADGELARG